MKFFESVFLLVLVACLAGNGACISSAASVTDITNFSYQASVQCPVIMCSGAIISTRNVLTTASCVNTLSATDVVISVGSAQYYIGGTIYTVANILINPNYVPSTYAANLAILTTTTAFDFSTSAVKPIPLASTMPAVNVYLTVSAYGAIDSSLTLPANLQRAALSLFSRTTCTTYKPTMATSMFCIGDSAGRKDLCPADQGAPAVYNGQLVGIYSWGAACGTTAASGRPSTPVFNSVPYFLAWIQANIVTP